MSYFHSKINFFWGFENWEIISFFTALFLTLFFLYFVGRFYIRWKINKTSDFAENILNIFAKKKTEKIDFSFKYFGMNILFFFLLSFVLSLATTIFLTDFLIENNIASYEKTKKVQISSNIDSFKKWWKSANKKQQDYWMETGKLKSVSFFEKGELENSVFTNRKKGFPFTPPSTEDTSTEDQNTGFVKTVFTTKPVVGKSDLSSPWSPFIKMAGKVNSYQITLFNEVIKYEKDYPGISRLPYFEDTFGLTSSKIGNKIISYNKPSSKLRRRAIGCTQFIWSTGKKYNMIYKGSDGKWYDKRYSIKDCIKASIDYYVDNKKMFKKHNLEYHPILSYVCHQQGDSGCIRIVKVIKNKEKKLNYRKCIKKNRTGKCIKTGLVKVRSNMLNNVGSAAKKNMLAQCWKVEIKNKKGKVIGTRRKCNDRLFAQIYFDYWSINAWREAGIAVEVMKSKTSVMAKL